MSIINGNEYKILSFNKNKKEEFDVIPDKLYEVEEFSVVTDERYAAFHAGNMCMVTSVKNKGGLVIVAHILRNKNMSLCERALYPDKNGKIALVGLREI